MAETIEKSPSLEISELWRVGLTLNIAVRAWRPNHGGEREVQPIGNKI